MTPNTPSQSHTAQTPTLTDKRKVNHKLILILLLLIFLGPFGFALKMHKTAQHSALKHNNIGDLIIPVKHVRDLQLINLNNVTNLDNVFKLNLPLFNTNKLAGKWQFIYIPPVHCYANCHDTIHTMGQIHHALHKSSSRLERMLVLLQDNTFSDFVQYDKKYYLNSVSYKNTLSSVSNKTKRETVGEFYIIDPKGHIMMYYTGDTPPKGILKDLNKLMKVSKIG